MGLKPFLPDNFIQFGKLAFTYRPFRIEDFETFQSWILIDSKILEKILKFFYQRFYLYVNIIMKKKKIKISLAQFKSILSLSDNRPAQEITIIMDGLDKEELGEVMKILSIKKIRLF